MAPPAPFEGGYPVARRLADEIADLLSPEAAEGTSTSGWMETELSLQAQPRCSEGQEAPERGRLFRQRGGTSLRRHLPAPEIQGGGHVPGDNSVDLLTQDIGLVAFTDPSGDLRGCNVYVGGGMGRTHNKEETFARTADPLGYVDAADVLDVVQAILALQRDHGDREEQHAA